MFGSPGEAKMKDLMEIWLEKQIVKSNISHYELAKKCGISATSISKWTNGVVYPKVIHLVAMCEVFAMYQNRNPRQLVFEALMNTPEMNNAETRWKKRNAKQEASKQ
jgi:transcriptional regulator with XRE-family HTH domain